MIPTAVDLCTHCTVPLAHDFKVTCEKCGKKSLNYCAACLLPCLPPGVPAPLVRLPLRVEVLRGKEESADKSTASMLAASSPDIRIWHLPDFPPIADARRVLLLYPSPTSVPVTEVDPAAFDALIVIDTTWQRAGGVLQLPQLAGPFVHVHLRGEFPQGGPHTVFWRHQPLGPACLSTAEATYYALRGLEVARQRKAAAEGSRQGAQEAASSSSSSSRGSQALEEAASSSSATATTTLGQHYDGRFDDLLAYFLAQYRKVQQAYGSGGSKEGQPYTRKMRAGYIQGAEAAAAAAGAAAGGQGGQEEAPAAVSNESRRKRMKLKGGWCVGTQFLAPEAAKVMAEAEQRFAANNVEGGGGGAAAAAVAAAPAAAGAGLRCERCAGMKHAYAATGRLLSREEVEEAAARAGVALEKGGE